MDESIPLDPETFGPEQACFGCGPKNDIGLKLRFERVGERVVSRFTLGRGYDGPPGILHGGLQALVLDEIAGWTLVGLRGRIGLTSSMTLRYLRSMRLNEELVAEGTIVAEENSVITVKATLSQDGAVGCVARVAYAMPDCEKMKEVLQGPLPEGWDKFFGGES
jgi:acyl-coenzyme A thioesterase PaaI-like protein